MNLEELAALVGHRFPGGTYRVAHWENWLLTDCTGREPMPDGLVHPIVLFHAPILGAGTSIAELFRLGGASGAGGSVGLVGYDWEYFEPLREDVEYRVDGGIVSAERRTSESGAVSDHVAFSIELCVDGDVHASITNRWQFRRAAPQSGGRVSSAASSNVDVQPTDAAQIPSWLMPSVDAARMKTMAAILRDPYPVHWDRNANVAIGHAGRVINQGPLNLGYVANMLMAWAGDDAIRRLTVSFGRPVLDSDEVVAGGRVLETRTVPSRRGDERVATCAVWLARGDEHVVTGTAEVRVV